MNRALDLPLFGPFDKMFPIWKLCSIFSLCVSPQKSLTRKDMEQYLENKARVFDILNRRRSLSLSMIRRLNPGLGIPADLLISPTVRSHRQEKGGARVYLVP
jgi:hypothetical protein